ncbi:DUF3995 domain-containing protein [uncultured Hyphomonas sp.]|uniref:DUF3995 domain-containing protein n=1 Tax=uncultured Hyphomonas sp. TaxID=225298 RepID=UPI002AAA9BDE|nr:DUF3995 domain-containing protein [uncultured Hyphomonas sp.]
MLAPTLSVVLAVILSIAGLLHALWGFGVTFPAANEQQLARMVVGKRGITKMPSMTACLFVAASLFAFAILSLVLGQHVQVPVSKWLVAAAGAAAAMAFMGRGILGVLPAFERALPEQPFLSLNRRFYSPLIILIGIGFALLTLALPYWSWRLGLLH